MKNQMNFILPARILRGNLIIILLGLFLADLSVFAQYHAEDLSGLSFRYDEVKGIGHENACTRRDPSDIIKVDGTFYVYYTKVYGRSPGYWGTLWYATSTDEGYSWKEENID